MADSLSVAAISRPPARVYSRARFSAAARPRSPRMCGNIETLLHSAPAVIRRRGKFSRGILSLARALAARRPRHRRLLLKIHHVASANQHARGIQLLADKFVPLVLAGLTRRQPMLRKKTRRNRGKERNVKGSP